MRITELIPESAWVVDQLLSAEECESIMDRAMEAGIVSSRAAGDIRYRNAAAIHFFDPELARQLYERIRCHLPEQIVVDENTSNDGLRHSKDNFLGTWRPCGVNERFLVSRYDALGHFGPHRDTGVVHDDNHRSLITLAAYLTDRPTGYGGATRFIRDDLDLFSREDGLITILKKLCVIQSKRTKRANQYCFYMTLCMMESLSKKGRRQNGYLEQMSSSSATRKLREARRALEQAEEFETQGAIQDAIRCYSKAYRLDPSLEHP